MQDQKIANGKIEGEEHRHVGCTNDEEQHVHGNDNTIHYHKHEDCLYEHDSNELEHKHVHDTNSLSEKRICKKLSHCK